MFKKDLIKDERALAFSIDALLALIIITVIIGVSANALDIVSFKITDYSSEKSLDRITADAADILVNTPGSPDDWEKNNSSLAGITPGLVESDSGNVKTKILSLKKIYRLQNKYKELMEGKIIPKGAKSSLIIYPTNPAWKPMVVMDETSLKDAKKISVVNRTVLCDFTGFFKVYTNILMDSSVKKDLIQNADLCPHCNLVGIKEHQKPDFNLQTEGWSCNHFLVNQNDLNSTDFYLITHPATINDAQAQWIMDRPENMVHDGQSLNSNPVMLNGRISELLGSDGAAVLWLHIFTSGDTSKSFNVYLVGVPKGTPLELVKAENMNPQPCFFVLKVWM